LLEVVVVVGQTLPMVVQMETQELVKMVGVMVLVVLLQLLALQTVVAVVAVADEMVRQHTVLVLVALVSFMLGLEHECFWWSHTTSCNSIRSWFWW
jgi:high-affinity nickel permease